MLSPLDSNARLMCQRREFLRWGGGLAAAGFVLPQAFLPASRAGDARIAPRAKSCILVYLLGGPPHLDMFDLKPDAPAEIRGPFQPISTSLPGVQICEHLPRLATIANQLAIVRSVSHPNSNHTPMIYYTLTGRETANPLADNDVRPPQQSDFPHMGAVISHLRGTDSLLPGYVAIPEVAVRSSISGEFKRARTPLRGGGAGFLGPRFEALCVNGEPGSREGVPALALPEGVAARRFEQRAEILSLLDQNVTPATSSDGFRAIRQRAMMLTGTANGRGKQVFTLDDESEAAKTRYGKNRFGQAMLLARRLTEAGVPLVAVHFNEMTICDGWDTHSKNFDALKSELLPYLDQGLSALIEDLDQRGRLDETLVACLGEFGRTPKINANAGRDHWGDCSTAVLAGGGIRGGQVLGASDKQGAYPITEPINPVDIQATMFQCLGLDPDQTILDPLNRPHAVCTGRVVPQLL